MPSKKMLPDDPASLVSADHFIRIVRPDIEAKWERDRAQHPN
jgi:hypothetical protein